MKGKEKCKALKEIRRQIAEKNDIPFAVSQCTFQGECTGTCPKCESELRYLEKELARRKKLGKAIAVAGISVSVCSTLSACSPIPHLIDSISDILDENISGMQEITEGSIAPEYEITGTPTPHDDITNPLNKNDAICIPEETEIPDSDETTTIPDKSYIAGMIQTPTPAITEEP